MNENNCVREPTREELYKKHRRYQLALKELYARIGKEIATKDIEDAPLTMHTKGLMDAVNMIDINDE